MPLHVTQRGVDRCPTFLDDEDHALYRWVLREASVESRCAVHAYVLMTNHVHLLLTPTDVGGPARLMRSLGGRYVRYFNRRHGRTGTLWEGRFRSTVVDSEPYFFACSRYIESNPTRAGLAATPIAYEWSSYHHNACGEADPVVTPHPQYLALGASLEVRCAAYRALFGAGLTSSALAAIRTAPRVGRTLPTTRYRQAVDALGLGSDAMSAHGALAVVHADGPSAGGGPLTARASPFAPVPAKALSDRSADGSA